MGRKMGDMKMKTRLNFDWVYNIWRESNLTENETLMASALMSAEMDNLNKVLENV